MARSRGKGSEPGPDAPGAPGADPRDAGPPGRVPELLRRMLALGFSGFFLTEEAVRKALGDTLPRDWADFAADQSERTRNEFLERLAREIAQTLESVDLAELAERLLTGNTIEVKAEFRFVPRDPEKPGQIFNVSVAHKGPRR